MKRYVIEKNWCEGCGTYNPDYFFSVARYNGWTRGDTISIEPDHVNEWQEFLNSTKVMCFSFYAECGGDAISLCLDCLKEAVEELGAA